MFIALAAMQARHPIRDDPAAAHGAPSMQPPMVAADAAADAADADVTKPARSCRMVFQVTGLTYSDPACCCRCLDSGAATELQHPFSVDLRTANTCIQFCSCISLPVTDDGVQPVWHATELQDYSLAMGEVYSVADIHPFAGRYEAKSNHQVPAPLARLACMHMQDWECSSAGRLQLRGSGRVRHDVQEVYASMRVCKTRRFCAENTSDAACMQEEKEAVWQAVCNALVSIGGCAKDKTLSLVRGFHMIGQPAEPGANFTTALAVHMDCTTAYGTLLSLQVSGLLLADAVSGVLTALLHRMKPTSSNLQVGARLTFMASNLGIVAADVATSLRTASHLPSLPCTALHGAAQHRTTWTQLLAHLLVPPMTQAQLERLQSLAAELYHARGRCATRCFCSRPCCP